MNKGVIVFGSPSDPHIKEVCLHLTANSIKSLVIDYYHNPINNIISFQNVNNNYTFIFKNATDELKDCEIGFIWSRVKPTFLKNPQNESEYISKSFIEREWHHLNNSLYCAPY